MNQVEFPQTIYGFFGILLSKPPCKVWDLEHFLMPQKSTLPLSEEGVPTICLLHAALLLKHPLRCWSLGAAPHLLRYCLLYCCLWHYHCHCRICTTAPSKYWPYPFLLLEWILHHPHLLFEIEKLILPQSFCEDVCHLFPCWSVLHLNSSTLYTVPDEVTPDINMLQPIMKHGIFKELDPTLIIA